MEVVVSQPEKADYVDEEEVGNTINSCTSF